MSDSIYAPMRNVTSKAQCFFYHVCDLPDGTQVGGHWDLRETVGDYLGQESFAGKRVLDIGTASGYLSFEMERRGASSVISFDQGHPSSSEFVPFHNDPVPRAQVIQNQVAGLESLKDSYWYMHRVNRSKALAFYGNVYEVPEALGIFDTVMIGMILPHLRDPMRALEACASRSRDTVIVTQQSIVEDRPIMQLTAHPGTDNIEHMRFAWWVMSDGLLTNFMQIMGFKLVNKIRTGHLCTAYTPNRVEDCTAFVFKRQ
jgi:hypothetical protein